MKTFSMALLLLSGWMAAAWLFFSGGLEPITVAAPRVDGGKGGVCNSIFAKRSADPSLAGALVGFCVLDEAGNTVFASPLAETGLCPASSLKTVTTGAAFELLGPDFRFETRLMSDAAMGPAGDLTGDLVLRGGGDPTLSSADLDALADAVLKAGLKQIQGGLRVDASVFPQAPVSDHWNWGDIGNGYGAGCFGVNVDHNRLSIRFEPSARVGGPAQWTGASPVASGTRWINQVTTGPPESGDGVVVYSEPYGRVITLQGTVPAGESDFTVSGAQPDPPALAAELLEARLIAAGVKIQASKAGEARPAAPPVENVLAAHQSAPLAEIIDHLHEVSDNLEAQSLFLTMGVAGKGDPAEVVRRHWESRGVRFSGLRLIDGSGLARANMIRPLDLARVNYAARRGPHGDRFRESLSASMDGKVRSKLGAMSGVRTEVGFLTLPDGREFTFALMANGLGPAADFKMLRNGLLESLEMGESLGP